MVRPTIPVSPSRVVTPYEISFGFDPHHLMIGVVYTKVVVEETLHFLRGQRTTVDHIYKICIIPSFVWTVTRSVVTLGLVK